MRRPRPSPRRAPRATSPDVVVARMERRVAWRRARWGFHKCHTWSTVANDYDVFIFFKTLVVDVARRSHGSFARDRRRIGDRDARAMSGAYDEVDLDDMEWNSELKAFTYQCPCGDFFQISLDELRNGEDIAHCPSCSLVLLVIYDPGDVPSEDELRARA